MHSLLPSLVFIPLAQCVLASMSPNLAIESRFGVSFSPTTITASRFNSSGSTELTAVPASSDYQAHYRGVVHSLQGLPHHSDAINITSVFRDAIRPVTENLVEQLGHAPEYAALFLPSVFDARTESAAVEAIFTNVQYATRAGPSWIATCYGYGFLEGKNLGRPSHECTEDGPENFIIVFEYEKEYIYAWLLVVAFELGTYPVMEERFGKDCGEEYREIIGDEVYGKRVNGFVHDFIQQQVLPRHKREDIRAVVIAGEASTAAIAELGAFALNEIGTKEVKLMTDFAPSEVVAYGAAVWARMTQQHPDRFTTYDGNRIPDDEYWAHERSEGRWTPDEHSEL